MMLADYFRNRLIVLTRDFGIRTGPNREYGVIPAGTRGVVVRTDMRSPLWLKVRFPEWIPGTVLLEDRDYRFVSPLVLLAECAE